VIAFEKQAMIIQSQGLEKRPCLFAFLLNVTGKPVFKKDIWLQKASEYAANADSA